MGTNTTIEWADHTFNPWIGCTAVSSACDFCYAERYGNRFGVEWGSGKPRRRTSESYSRQPFRWNREAAASGTRPFVFCASLADVFDNEVDPQWRADLFATIRVTPNLVWLLLTKRIGNVLKMVDLDIDLGTCRNVAFGATMANLEEYDRDRMKLAEVKRALNPLFTFGSLEPLLGRIILDKNAPDWIIVGGESGSHARPIVPDDVRYLRDQCAQLGRVFHFKQWGGVDKKASGRELDGQIHDGRPVVPALEAA